MTERSFEALQKEMIAKLSNSFETSRADILKIEPSLHEWNRQLKKLEHLRDENSLHQYLLANLDITDHSKTHLDESTQETLLAPLKQTIKSYLEFLPHENFSRANEILNTIRGLNLNTYESISEFVKLRSELSKQLNNHITSKCQKIQAQISDLLKNLRFQLHNLPPEQSALSKTDFQSKKAHSAFALFENFAPSGEELETARVKRYNLTLTNEDILSLKSNSALSPNLVNFFGNYLNERSQGSGTLFLNHGIANILLSDHSNQDFTERHNTLKAHTGGVLTSNNVWETYERVCIPYTDAHIIWCLLIIENKGETAWLADFGQGLLEENNAKILIANFNRYISAEEIQQQQSCDAKRIAYGGESNEVGSPLLWEMYGLALKGDEQRGEGERARFAQLLFQTLLLLGTNNHKFLKFDELL